jgi:DNA-binding GntR family transcriptional regulator
MVDDSRPLHIRQVTLRDIRDLFSLRVLLESEGVALAVHNITDRDEVRELEELGWGASYDPADSASINEFIRRNTEFHARLTALGGNAWLTASLRDVLEQLERIVYVVLSEAIEIEPDVWMHEHQELLGAVLGGDEDEARRVATALASQAQKRVITLMIRSDRKGPPRPPRTSSVAHEPEGA